MRNHRILRRHLSFANVCAGMALLLTLTGGVAWAATQIAPNSIRAKHIAAKQVRAKHIAPGTIKARHLSKGLRGKGANGLQGPRGPQGTRGAKGEAGPQGVKGSADGVLMGRGPLTRHLASGSPYTEIPLGSINEFTVYGHCVDSSYPIARVYIRAAAAGGLVIGSMGNAGGYSFTVPTSIQVHSLETQANPYAPKRYGQYAATLVSANGEIHDVRGISYVQRAEDQNPLFAPGRACGFNEASILRASR